MTSQSSLPYSMAAPGFGFSFGDFVAAASLINEIRKALRDVGGAKDEFQQISIELQHLEILLDQLNRGSWDHGGDPGHLNAVKGVTLACKVPLEEFLIKFQKYKILPLLLSIIMMSSAPSSKQHSSCISSSFGVWEGSGQLVAQSPYNTSTPQSTPIHLKEVS